jgi:hypothetical protein
VITPCSSAPDTTASIPRRILSFLVLDAKGGERVDSGGVLREGFVFLCVLHSCIMFIFSALAFCDMCACEILESCVDYLVTIIYHVT